MSTLPCYFWFAPVAAIAALVAAYAFFKNVMSFNKGTARMQEIAGFVQKGAYAYLKQQYKVVGLTFLVLTILLAILAFLGVQNPFVPFAFLTGGFFSGLCGFIGMKTATEASSRTAFGAQSSLNQGLKVAFRAGAVMGLIVVGFGLLDIAAWFFALNYIYDNNIWGLSLKLAEHVGIAAGAGTFDPAWISDAAFIKGKIVEITTTMLTFGMGASTQALFARVGGGIYTKAADVGADLVGKVEANIPEDDPRNPATIADNVGDNVGDVAGMGADLYESYCGCILATAAIGASLAVGVNTNMLLAFVISPMLVAAIGSILSIIGVLLVRTGENAEQKQLLRALGIAVWIPSVGIAAAIFLIFYFLGIPMGVAWAVVTGLLAGIIIGQATEYTTSDEYAPTKGIAQAATTGHATAIIEGVAVGFLSTGIPVVTIVIGIILSFALAGGFSDFAMGLYGVGFSAVGMLATLGVTLATDAYGPIADNAGGNAEMSGLGPEVRKRTDALDMLGNTTAATGKGFAIGSAGLTALALLVAYIEELRIWIGRLAQQSIDGLYRVGDLVFAPNAQAASLTGAIDVTQATIADFVAAFDLSALNPYIIAGIFVGAMVVFVFCALTMKAVGRAASSMVEEVRRQFKEIPGIMEGKAIPEYAKCVAISTAGAQRAMMFPTFLAILTPIIVGLVFGIAGVFGLLIGGLTTGFSVAVMLNNAGGAWDNAKKFVEKGNHGGKGSPTHKACVTGDTVGDPFKDTSGPSVNILIKVMSMVSVVFAGMLLAYGGLIEKIFN